MGGGREHKSSEPNEADLRRAEQSEEREKRSGEGRGEDNRAEQGAEQRDPARSSLSVCTAELLLLAHLLHHLDHPPPPSPPPHPLLTTLSLPSLPLAAFSFTCGSLQRRGSLLVRRTKMDGMEGAMDGGWRVGVGWVCVCVWVWGG